MTEERENQWIRLEKIFIVSICVQFQRNQNQNRCQFKSKNNLDTKTADNFTGMKGEEQLIDELTQKELVMAIKREHI